jgi:hypothetical protein
MTHLDQHKAGLVVGVFVGGWHVIWSILVLIGWGQALIDFVLWAHMVHLPYIVGPFDVVPAATLIVLTTVAGYAIGWIFGFIWNRLHRANV